MRLSLCCDCELVSDMGYMTCSGCGKQSTQHLETNSCSFTHQPKVMMSRSYSRKSRFFKKCLRMLRCRMNYRVDDNLVKFLKTKEIETPEKLFLEMSLFPCKKRRPFDAIMFYWAALGKNPPQCTENDIKQLKLDFDNIFFAWKRLGFQPPRFPYAFLFRKIVQAKSTMYSPGILEMTRFVRKLRCVSRKARYDELFEECLNFDYTEDIYKEFGHPIYKMSKHTPMPKDMPKQIVTREKIKPMMLDTANLKNVYKTEEEFQEALKNNTFDIAKTFHIDNRGRFYTLCYKPDEIPMQDVQLQDEQKIQLEATQKLNELLRAQSLL